VGKAPAWLPGDGVQDRDRWISGMTTNSPVAARSFALTRSSPRLCSSAREANRHIVNRPPPFTRVRKFSGPFSFGFSPGKRGAVLRVP
jgi:hypothetical protein